MNEDKQMNTGLVLTKEGIGDILRMVHGIVYDVVTAVRMVYVLLNSLRNLLTKV